MNNNQIRTGFMQSPLVTWVKTLLDEGGFEYSELCSGTLLSKAWLQIDPHATCLTTKTSALEASSFSMIRNLSTLLNNIRAFYENVLDQILVMKLPDVINIVLSCNDDLLISVSRDNPFYGLINAYSSNVNCDDMRIFLLLILGCAVQCEQKEVFIEKIKQLDISTQHSIVECIQQITDNPESVFMVSEWTEPPADEEEKDRLYSVFVRHIARLTKERDQLYQRVVDLSCELFTLTLHSSTLSPANSASIKNLSLSNSSLNNNINYCDQKSHYLVELADVKSKLRRLQQEVEEKNEIIVESREIIEQSKETCNKLKHDNLELTQEARSAKAYRDEIDVLNERVRKIDRLEAEVQRYRDKMNELEFYKTRVDELREDNRILGETKTMLEEQLDTSRKRAEKLPELEEKILKLNAYGNELNLQRELDRNQIERLIEEIAHVKQEKKFSNEELARVQLELTDLRAQIRLNNETSLLKSEEGNLFDQMNQDASKRIIKLEHENKKLQSTIEDYKNNYVDIDSLLSMFSTLELDALLNGNEDGQINESKDFRSSPDSGFSSSKSKTERLNEVKLAVEKLIISQKHVKKLENDKIVFEKEINECRSKLREETNKLETMERNYSQVVAENQKHQRIIEQKQKRIDEYETDLNAIENENQKLQTNAESLKLSLRKLNDLEIEMTNIESDKQKLEQDKKSLEKEINRLKTSIEFKDVIIDENASKLSSYELENKRLKKEFDSQQQLNGKLKELEKENKDLTSGLAVQKKTLSTLQQELIGEKVKTQKYTDEFEKLVETVNKLCLENGINDTTMIMPKDIGVLSGTSFREAIERCLAKKDSNIEHLQGLIRDLKSDNHEMQTLINSLKRQLNVDEESPLECSLNSLEGLQKKIFYLEDENKSLKADLHSYKDNLSELTIQSEVIESKLNQINERNSELQSENAKLEVENSLLTSQNSSLESQTVELQEQMALIQDSIEQFQRRCEEYENTQKLLMSDNESLQEIHLQLTADYDNLVKNHNNLKQSYKLIKSEKKLLEDELKLLLEKHQELVDKTEQELKNLKEIKEKSTSEDGILKEKLSSLTSEHKSLTDEHNRLQAEHKMLQNIYKKLRSDNNELKLKHTELQGETAECKDRMSALNVEVSKLSSYCEMVAMTNNTLEVQRKMLATQSASLLTQYNDLLIEMSIGCESSIKDKLRELCIKKERLEKMFKEYDISFEKNMPRVANKRLLTNHQSGMDDNIYGLLWEAETPAIPQTEFQFNNSTSLLKQYSINNLEPDKKLFEFSTRSPPPRIPPRQHVQRQSISLTQTNCKETSIEVTQNPSFSSENKMSINISSRSSSTQIGKMVDNKSIESNISKLHISSNSPFVAKSVSGLGNALSNSSNNYFMRGSFKSNSVNYGNLMRRSASGEPTVVNHKAINAASSTRHEHHSPQLLTTVLTSRSPGTATAQRIYSTASPSLNSSDSSSSSYTAHDESEKEVDGMTHRSTLLSAANNNVSTTRSRIVITNSTSGCANETTNATLGSDQINIQISNALNNNTDVPSDNATPGASASNSIWYEYGCV